MFLTIRDISSRAEKRSMFEINGKKLGVVVCEDFWNDKTFWKERLYDEDPADELINQGADVIISINASPYNKGKIKLRCDMVAHRARSQKVPIVFVNLVGGNDGIIFDGASLIADEEGDIILQATAFEEFVETVELDVRKPDSRGIEGDELESIRRALVLGIKDYAHKNRFKTAVLGLSGGIDSAIVATLAAEALGAENVLCVMMPSPFSSEGSISHSEKLIENLGCESRIEPISGAFEVLLNQLEFTETDQRRRKSGGGKYAVAFARRDFNEHFKRRRTIGFSDGKQIANSPSVTARFTATRTAVWRLSATF